MTEEENVQEESTQEEQNISQDISGLTIIERGAKAESKPLNDNFVYLNTRATMLNNRIDTLSTGIDQRVTQIANDRLDDVFYTINIISGANAKGQIQLAANKAYSITPSDEITFILTGVDTTVKSNGEGKFHQILVQLNLEDTDYFNADGLGTTHYFDDIEPSFANTGFYDIIYEYDNAAGVWFVGAMYKGMVS